MSYVHKIVIWNRKTSQYSQQFQDYVVDGLRFCLTTRDMNTGNIVSSGYINLSIGAPDANNFVPYSSINNETLLSWIDQNCDVVALQNENISKLTVLR